MNNQILQGILISTILSSCNIFTSEPSDAEMKSSLAKWQKIKISSITDFSKKSCTEGRINYLYDCTFEMSVNDGTSTTKLSLNRAGFVSHDSGATWIAYPH